MKTISTYWSFGANTDIKVYKKTLLSLLLCWLIFLQTQNIYILSKIGQQVLQVLSGRKKQNNF